MSVLISDELDSYQIHNKVNECHCDWCVQYRINVQIAAKKLSDAVDAEVFDMMLKESK